ncbi:16688_t:CDS:2, partial [Funneliformis geosporum]
QKFQNSERDNNEEYNSSDNEDLDMGFEQEDEYFNKEESLFQTLVDNIKILYHLSDHLRIMKILSELKKKEE